MNDWDAMSVKVFLACVAAGVLVGLGIVHLVTLIAGAYLL